MATLISADGSEREVSPSNPKKGFTLKELYALIDCTTVQMIEIGEGSMMWMDEDGKYRPELHRNNRATALLQNAGGAPDDCIVGTVLITNPGEIK